MLCEECSDSFQRVGGEAIIRSEESDVLAVSGVDATVQRDGNTAVGLMESQDPIVLGRVLVDDRRCRILGPVIDDDDFDIFAI